MMPINLAPWRETNIIKTKKIILFQFIIEFIILLIVFEICETKNSNLALSQKTLYRNLEIEFENVHGEYSTWGKIQENEPLGYKKYELLKKNIEENRLFLHILNEINKNLPKNTYLTRIEKKENDIFVAGQSSSHLELSSFLKLIENTIQKNHPTIKTSESENNFNEINFNIQFTINIK